MTSRVDGVRGASLSYHHVRTRPYGDERSSHLPVALLDTQSCTIV